MRNAERIPVLMYHRVGEPDHARDIYCIRPERFAAQMQALAQAGYRAIDIADFAAWRGGAQTLPEQAFVLSFDDGFSGVHEFAAPVLKALAWPATVFLVAGKLAGQSDWDITTGEPMPPHPLMDASQLRALCAQGFSLQSHSLLHRDLTQLQAPILEQDLRESRALIADIAGNAPKYLAYPYGRHNPAVRSAAELAGFDLAFSV